jgi:hypothetical protein
MKQRLLILISVPLLLCGHVKKIKNKKIVWCLVGKSKGIYMVLYGEYVLTSFNDA